MVLVVAVVRPLDGRDRPADVTHLPVDRRDREHDPGDDADGRVGQEAVDDATAQVFHVDPAQQDQDAVDGGRCAGDPGEDDDQPCRDPEQERRRREDRTDDESHDDPEDGGIDAEPVHEADAEDVAEGAAGDRDRRVVPQVRDDGQDGSEHEADAP